MTFIVALIHWLIVIVSLIVIVDVVLSYIMSPFHPLRMKLDQIVQPMLAPIRRFLPRTGSLDFSPLVLLILLQLLDVFLQRLFLGY